VLAYVFWHGPRQDGDAGAYERALGAFQRALLDAAPDGLLDCSSHAVEGAPWLPDPVYEDWYLLGDWAALGTLNHAAVDARRRSSHDALAAAAAAGAGGVYLLRSGPPRVHAADHALWHGKPPGVSYSDFRARLERVAGDGGAIWERQLVLGPAPEYCVITDDGAAAAPVAATVVRRRTIFAGRDEVEASPA
jgi:hypothetical protein